MIKFILAYFLLWLIYFYDRKLFINELHALRSKLIEKDHDKIVLINGKNPKIFFKFRISIALTTLCLTILLFNQEINLYKVLLILILAIGIYKGLYFNEVKKYHDKLKRANIEFPYYLNQLSMLVSNEPVVNALSDSINEAPEVFKDDLIILVKDIHLGIKDGVTAYLDFANKFREVEDMRRIMITLYNMNHSNKDGKLILTSLCKLANEKLGDANQIKLDSNLDKQALMPWILFFWVGFVMIMLFINIDLSSLGELK